MSADRGRGSLVAAEGAEGLPSSLEKVEAVLSGPLIYALSEVIPDKPREGRPRDYASYMWLVYHVLVNYVWPSARRVEAEIGHPEVWRFMRETVRRRFPNDPSMWLPERPMRRHHYVHACRYLRDPVIVERMEVVYRRESTALAAQMGMLREGPISWTHPDPDRFMQADGKVITPLYRSKTGTRLDRETGEVRNIRSDPDATLHIEGGGSVAFGNKYVLVSRNEYERLLLDIERDSGKKGDGGEAACALRCLERLAPLVPGAQGVVYDKAMRGVHIDHAMRQLGWLILTGVHAVRDPDGSHEVRHVEDTDGRTSDGRTVQASIYARDGAAGLGELTETGDMAFLPIERLKTERRSSARGYRFYNVYRLPDSYGGRELRIRLTGNDEDESRGLNRAERLRAIPPPDPDFARVFRRRNDAESLNRAVEDSFYWARAHSVGAIAQEADLLGFGIGLNALSWHRHRKREMLYPAA